MSKKYITLTFIIISLLIGAIYWGTQLTREMSKTKLPPGSSIPPNNVKTNDVIDPIPAPNFSLTTLAGNTVSLKKFKGKPVVLSFWTTW